MATLIDNGDLELASLICQGRTALKFKMKCNFVYLTNRGSRMRLRRMAQTILILLDNYEREFKL